MFWKLVVAVCWGFAFGFIFGYGSGVHAPSNSTAIAPSPSPSPSLSPSPVPSPTPVPMTTTTPSPSPTPTPESSAVPYQVVESSEGRIAGRLRTVVNIVAPEAETFEQRGETVILAAQEIQAENDSDVVLVFLDASEALAGEGVIEALSRYAPDGGGLSGDQDWRWEVTASRSPVTSQEIAIAEAWVSRSKDFQISDGFGGMQTDEDALSAELAAEFGVSPDEVGLVFFIKQEDYPSPD